MFNGIIINTGKIKRIFRKKNNCEIQIFSKLRLKKHEVGSSVSCSGVCLTVEKFKKNLINFYLTRETLSRSNFKFMKIGDIINLEKPVIFGDRISGHFVQGHVDTVSTIEKIQILGKSWLVSFKIKNQYKRYLVEKGSVSINGVSLTISKIIKNGFQIAVIPKTLKLTNLIYLKKNDFVNVEFDILGKYIMNIIK